MHRVLLIYERGQRSDLFNPVTICWTAEMAAELSIAAGCRLAASTPSIVNARGSRARLRPKATASARPKPWLEDERESGRFKANPSQRWIVPGGASPVTTASMTTTCGASAHKVTSSRGSSTCRAATPSARRAATAYGPTPSSPRNGWPSPTISGGAFTAVPGALSGGASRTKCKGRSCESPARSAR